jgi:phosphatidylserine synthase
MSKFQLYRISTKDIPNILSISRIILALSLAFLYSYKITFLLLYMLAGFTDFADGYIARKYKLKSDIGAKLDSSADFVFFVVVAFVLYSIFTALFISNLFLILTVFIIRIFSIVAGFIKHKKLIFIHTIANKITGLALFITPIVLMYFCNEIFIILLLALAIFSAIEETLIILFSSQIDLNTKSVFDIKN